MDIKTKVVKETKIDITIDEESALDEVRMMLIKLKKNKIYIYDNDIDMEIANPEDYGKAIEIVTALIENELYEFQ